MHRHRRAHAHSAHRLMRVSLSAVGEPIGTAAWQLDAGHWESHISLGTSRSPGNPKFPWEERGSTEGAGAVGSRPTHFIP